MSRVESSPCHGLLSLAPAPPMKTRLGPGHSPEPRPKHTGILQKPASTLGLGDLRRPEPVEQALPTWHQREAFVCAPGQSLPDSHPPL